VHLIVAGPSVEAVADDPEGAQVLEEVYEAWSELSGSDRERVHLAMIPMEDGDENAAIVNAMQRRADVVVQKSLAEGFGLTVAEAMWKGRAVVASRIGGIQDQIEDEKTGLLVDDPTDLDEYGSDVKVLLDDPDRAARIGVAARDRVRDNFLGPRHLIQYQKLMSALLERKS
jgi:trehalose synthase